MKNKPFLKALALPLLGAALLTACAPQTATQFQVHEALLYGQAQDHLAWVYGKLGSGKSTLNIAGQTQEVLPGRPQDTLYTPGSLRVAGKAVYAGRTQSVAPAASVVRLDDSYSVSALRDVQATYLLENGQWSRLSGGLAGGAAVQVSASPLEASSGVGNLSGAEAAALARVLAAQGPLVVSVLPSAPDMAYKVQPAPAEQQSTALYLQPLMVAHTVVTQSPLVSSTNPSSIPAATNPTMTNTPVPQPATFRTVANGSNAAIESPSVLLAGSQAAFESIWRSAYGRQTPLPTTPLLGSQTAVGIFLGTRATGGYGVQVDSVTPQGSRLDVRVTVHAPGKGSITTQAITSPWVIFSVSGRYSEVHVTDQDGNELK